MLMQSYLRETGISRFAQADSQNITWNSEGLDGAGQREGVGRNNTDIGSDINKTALIEIFRIDNRRVDVGEYLEFI
jgi:hypothetical protein